MASHSDILVPGIGTGTGGSGVDIDNSSAGGGTGILKLRVACDATTKPVDVSINAGASIDSFLHLLCKAAAIEMDRIATIRIGRSGKPIDLNRLQSTLSSFEKDYKISVADLGIKNRDTLYLQSVPAAALTTHGTNPTNPTATLSPHRLNTIPSPTSSLAMAAAFKKASALIGNNMHSNGSGASSTGSGSTSNINRHQTTNASASITTATNHNNVSSTGNCRLNNSSGHSTTILHKSTASSSPPPPPLTVPGIGTLTLPTTTAQSTTAIATAGSTDSNAPALSGNEQLRQKLIHHLASSASSSAASSPTAGSRSGAIAATATATGATSSISAWLSRVSSALNDSKHQRQKSLSNGKSNEFDKAAVATASSAVSAASASNPTSASSPRRVLTPRERRRRLQSNNAKTSSPRHHLSSSSADTASIASVVLPTDTPQSIAAAAQTEFDRLQWLDVRLQAMREARAKANAIIFQRGACPDDTTTPSTTTSTRATSPTPPPARRITERQHTPVTASTPNLRALTVPATSHRPWTPPSAATSSSLSPPSLPTFVNLSSSAATTSSVAATTTATPAIENDDEEQPGAIPTRIPVSAPTSVPIPVSALAPVSAVARRKSRSPPPPPPPQPLRQSIPPAVIPVSEPISAVAPAPAPAPAQASASGPASTRVQQRTPAPASPVQHVVTPPSSDSLNDTSSSYHSDGEIISEHDNTNHSNVHITRISRPAAAATVESAIAPIRMSSSATTPASSGVSGPAAVPPAARTIVAIPSSARAAVPSASGAIQAVIASPMQPVSSSRSVPTTPAPIAGTPISVQPSHASNSSQPSPSKEADVRDFAQLYSLAQTPHVKSQISSILSSPVPETDKVTAIAALLRGALDGTSTPASAPSANAFAPVIPAATGTAAAPVPIPTAASVPPSASALASASASTTPMPASSLNAASAAQSTLLAAARTKPPTGIPAAGTVGTAATTAAGRKVPTAATTSVPAPVATETLSMNDELARGRIGSRSQAQRTGASAAAESDTDVESVDPWDRDSDMEQQSPSISSSAYERRSRSLHSSTSSPSIPNSSIATISTAAAAAPGTSPRGVFRARQRPATASPVVGEATPISVGSAAVPPRERVARERASYSPSTSSSVPPLLRASSGGNTATATASDGFSLTNAGATPIGSNTAASAAGSSGNAGGARHSHLSFFHSPSPLYTNTADPSATATGTVPGGIFFVREEVEDDEDDESKPADDSKSSEPTQTGTAEGSDKSKPAAPRPSRIFSHRTFFHSPNPLAVNGGPPSASASRRNSTSAASGNSRSRSRSHSPSPTTISPLSAQSLRFSYPSPPSSPGPNAAQQQPGSAGTGGGGTGSASSSAPPSPSPRSPPLPPAIATTVHQLNSIQHESERRRSLPPRLMRLNPVPLLPSVSASPNSVAAAEQAAEWSIDEDPNDDETDGDDESNDQHRHTGPGANAGAGAGTGTGSGTAATTTGPTIQLSTLANSFRRSHATAAAVDVKQQPTSGSVSTATNRTGAAAPAVTSASTLAAAAAATTSSVRPPLPPRRIDDYDDDWDKDEYMVAPSQDAKSGVDQKSSNSSDATGSDPISRYVSALWATAELRARTAPIDSATAAREWKEVRQLLETKLPPDVSSMRVESWSRYLRLQMDSVQTHRQRVRQQLKYLRMLNERRKRERSVTAAAHAGASASAVRTVTPSGTAVGSTTANTSREIREQQQRVDSLHRQLSRVRNQLSQLQQQQQKQQQQQSTAAAAPVSTATATAMPSVAGTTVATTTTTAAPLVRPPTRRRGQPLDEDTPLVPVAPASASASASAPSMSQQQRRPNNNRWLRTANEMDESDEDDEDDYNNEEDEDDIEGSDSIYRRRQRTQLRQLLAIQGRQLEQQQLQREEHERTQRLHHLYASSVAQAASAVSEGHNDNDRSSDEDEDEYAIQMHNASARANARAVVSGSAGVYDENDTDGDADGSADGDFKASEAAAVGGANEWELRDFTYEHLLTLEDVAKPAVLPEVFRRLPKRALTTEEIARFKRHEHADKRRCTICLADFEVGESVLTITCLHVFHTVCITQWLTQKATCPLCRSAVTE